jgi:hypothetical protein
MTKNTNNTDFRNIDIDAYGENNFDEGDDKLDLDERGPDEIEIKKLLDALVKQQKLVSNSNLFIFIF